MQTPSHLLITVVLGHYFRRRGIAPSRRAWWLGAIAPDVPFALLFLSTWFYGRSWLGWDNQTIHDKIHHEYFFESPWWVYPHNALHAPLVLVVLALVACFMMGSCSRAWWLNSPCNKVRCVVARALLWFVIAATLHTAIDILTHAGDGPLLGFPFNMSYRFQSAVSYWNPEHYGRWFIVLELLLDTTLIACLRCTHTVSNK